MPRNKELECDYKEDNILLKQQVTSLLQKLSRAIQRIEQSEEAIDDLREKLSYTTERLDIAEDTVISYLVGKKEKSFRSIPNESKSRNLPPPDYSG